MQTNDSLSSLYNPRFIYIMAPIAAMAGLLFGFDHGIIAPALVYLTPELNLAEAQVGMISGAVPLGALLGALLSGRLTDYLGRRRTIIITAIIFAAGSMQTALAPSIEWITIGRTALGFAIGIASFTAPLYLAELSPYKVRGALVSLNQLAITIGIFAAYSTGYFFSSYPVFQGEEWRWMFAFGVVPAIILLVGMYYLPESPRWLMAMGRENQANSILYKIHQTKEAELEIQEIKASLQGKKETWRSLFEPWLFPALAIGLGINLFQQITGINSIIYYAPVIFKTAGFDSENMAIFVGLIVSVVNVLATIVSIMIIDKVGRKPLLFIGLTGMLLSLTFLGFADRFADGGNEGMLRWLTLGSVLVYIPSFAISMGPIAWLIISEIFPLRIRGLAMSLAVATNWISAMLVVSSFPILLGKFGLGNTFWFFAIMCVLALLFVYRFIPETKNVTLEEIEDNLKAGKPIRDIGRSHKIV